MRADCLASPAFPANLHFLTLIIEKLYNPNEYLAFHLKSGRTLPLREKRTFNG